MITYFIKLYPVFLWAFPMNLNNVCAIKATMKYVVSVSKGGSTHMHNSQMEFGFFFSFSPTPFGISI